MSFIIDYSMPLTLPHHCLKPKNWMQYSNPLVMVGGWYTNEVNKPLSHELHRVWEWKSWLLGWPL
jgi:hypothetical protein